MAIQQQKRTYFVNSQVPREYCQSRIGAKSMREDICPGLSEAGLMARHGLSPEGLKRLFKEPVHAKIVTHQDLYKRFPSYRERTNQLLRRRARRVHLSVRMRVRDVGSTSFGIVRDVSETGLRVAGIKYEAGDVTVFQLPIDVLINADPLSVIAKCRWVSEKGKEKEYFAAGFELVGLSPAGGVVLKKFINLLLLSKCGKWTR
jgi:hypothetical protein